MYGIVGLWNQLFGFLKTQNTVIERLLYRDWEASGGSNFRWG